MRRIFFLMAVMVAASATAVAMASPAGAGAKTYPWATASASAYVCHGTVYLKVRLTNVDTIAHSANVGVNLFGVGWVGYPTAYSVKVLAGHTWTYSYSAVAHRGYEIGIAMTGVHIWQTNDPMGVLMLDQSASASVIP